MLKLFIFNVLAAFNEFRQRRRLSEPGVFKDHLSEWRATSGHDAHAARRRTWQTSTDDTVVVEPKVAGFSSDDMLRFRISR